MATVTFYEKPGCFNNARQKRLLEAAGHWVIARNLLTEPWTGDRLRPFFVGLPVPQWFNASAPAIAAGVVVPAQLDADTALELMVLNPLLIRRPLLEVEGDRLAGWDSEAIDRWIGLTVATPTPDLETCPRTLALRRG